MIGFVLTEIRVAKCLVYGRRIMIGSIWMFSDFLGMVKILVG